MNRLHTSRAHGHCICKTRPEGVLWEMDVEEALAKLAK